MVKMRLKQLHQHGEILLTKGSSIEVDERRAMWMEDNEVAEREREDFSIAFPDNLTSSGAADARLHTEENSPGADTAPREDSDS